MIRLNQLILQNYTIYGMLEDEAMFDEAFKKIETEMTNKILKNGIDYGLVDATGICER